MTTYIGTGVFGIKVTLEGAGGSIVSDLRYDKEDDESVRDYDVYIAVIDGLESLILAHACAGIDITTPAYLEGIEIAVGAIMHNY